MMKRKVIQLAGKTLVVSLPSKWARQQNIIKGAEVEVFHDSKGLHIQPDSTKPLATISVDLRQVDNPTVKSVLSVLHKSGYDELEILYNPEQQQVIHERIRTNLMGYEIVQQSSQRMIIQNVTGDADTSFETLMRRVFLVTLELAAGVEKAMHSQTNATELLSLEETNNKLTNYCHRILNKSQAGKYVFVYTLIWLQEKIADDYKNIIHLMENKQHSLSAQKAATTLHECIRIFYETAYAKNLETIAKARQHIEKVKIDVKDELSAAFFSVKRHLLEGLGSLTGLVFAQQ